MSEEVIRVETLKIIRKIFEQMKIIRYSCHIDSLVRIDDEDMYDCEKCILADTLDVKREDICPLNVKRDMYVLK